MDTQARIIDLMTMDIREVELYVLKHYSNSQSVDVGRHLDHAIVIPPKDPTRDYALLVAHTDTVFKRPLKRDEIGQRGPVLYSKHERMGLGADDRAGIAACLDLYDRLDNVAVLLCPNEETGCEGSRAIKPSHLNEHIDLDRLCYALQFDRRGSRDIVTYGVASDDFIDYLESHLYGYRHAQGSFSDIAMLCPTLSVSGANISIGYDDEHTFYETLDLLDYQRTVMLVGDMLASTADAMAMFDLPEKAGYGWGDDDEYEDDYYGHHWMADYDNPDAYYHGELLDIDDAGNAIRWDGDLREAVDTGQPPTDAELQLYFENDYTPVF